ncbi:4Fe-4S binding protein [Candidatus Bathyarchaeota archaeon]|nr:4Fe-4S binding protein [Candidatus Bathyarchaeota archaeon]
MPEIRISEALCKGCYLCIAFCPFQVLKKSESLSPKGIFPVVIENAGKCTGCRICEFFCPEFAIYVVKEG